MDCSLLPYSAVGCPDFTLPDHAESRREGARVIVSCKEDTSLSWERKCVGTKWIGEVRTCPAPNVSLDDKSRGTALPIGRYGG